MKTPLTGASTKLPPMDCRPFTANVKRIREFSGNQYQLPLKSIVKVSLVASFVCQVKIVPALVAAEYVVPFQTSVVSVWVRPGFILSLKVTRIFPVHGLPLHIPMSVDKSAGVIEKTVGVVLAALL